MQFTRLARQMFRQAGKSPEAGAWMHEAERSARKP
jgi:hypothetical protein